MISKILSMILLVTAPILISADKSIEIAGLRYLPYSETDVSKHHEAIVYFTADWCIYCKVFQSNVLAKSEIQDRLKKVPRYVYDLTSGNESDWAVLREYGGYGVPHMILIKKDGTFVTITSYNDILKHIK